MIPTHLQCALCIFNAAGMKSCARLTLRSIDLDGVSRKVYSFIDCSITDAAHIIAGIL